MNEMCLQRSEPMEYQSIDLARELSITSIFTVHYFEYSKSFVFTGERHDFWELVCVDSGTVIIQADEHEEILHKGDMIFHKPNEFHALRADGISSPSLFVISFSCNSECMKFFENRRVKINQTEHFYLGQILAEAQHAFSTDLHHPFINRLERRKQQTFGSEQILSMTIELMLLSIYRRYNTIGSGFLFETSDQSFHPATHRNHAELIQQVEAFMYRNVYHKLTINDICHANMVGRSNLQNIYHKERGYGVMEGFTRIRIEEAKRLIRDGNYTFNQIADRLNYSSYQFFSLQFKKHTHLSPSEYRSSIRQYTVAALEEGQLPPQKIE